MHNFYAYCHYGYWPCFQYRSVLGIRQLLNKILLERVWCIWPRMRQKMVKDRSKSLKISIAKPGVQVHYFKRWSQTFQRNYQMLLLVSQLTIWLDMLYYYFLINTLLKRITNGWTELKWTMGIICLKNTFSLATFVPFSCSISGEGMNTYLLIHILF